MNQLNEDLNGIKLKIERVNFDIEKLQRTKTKIIQDEELKGKKSINDLNSNQNNSEKLQIKELERTKVHELKRSIAMSFEPEILRLVSNNKKDLEELRHSCDEQLDNFKIKIKERYQVLQAEKERQIEEIRRKQCEDFRTQQQKLIADLCADHDNNYKTLQEKHLRDCEEEDRLFEEDRKFRSAVHSKDLRKLYDEGQNKICEARSTHERKMKALEDAHKVSMLEVSEVWKK